MTTPDAAGRPAVLRRWAEAAAAEPYRLVPAVAALELLAERDALAAELARKAAGRADAVATPGAVTADELAALREWAGHFAPRAWPPGPAAATVLKLLAERELVLAELRTALDTLAEVRARVGLLAGFVGAVPPATSTEGPV